MAGSTYKCPSCGGYLTFDPDTQGWKCPYCGATYTEEEMLGREEEHTAQATDGSGSGQVMYHCSSCGSEIVTDATTVATHCYYCHNPVVLQGKMGEEFRPDQVLPFQYDREAALEKFMAWVKTKKFVPDAFFSAQSVENLTGVYYPHFVTECTVKGSLSGVAKDVNVQHFPNRSIYHTQIYNVLREGKLTFRNLMRPALKSANRKLSDAIHPFPLEQAKAFDGAYLSGFVAERRDMAAEDYKSEILEEVKGYVKPMLSSDVHHQSLEGSCTASLLNYQSKYVLLPTWVLTYPNPKKPEDPYYYAMNGCTGEICGKLPLDRGKLLRHALLIGGIVLAVLLLICYFLI